MAARYSQPDLQRLARDLGIGAQELPTKLPDLSGSQPANFKSQADELRAEQILQEQISSGLQRKPSVLTRTISKRRQASYTYKNATAALPKVVEDETAGVVQALLEIGGEANAVKNKETKGAQTEERARLLVAAVRAGKRETVCLLAPQSPRPAQNEALAQSLALGHQDITTKLLQYNADPNHCRSQFDHAVEASDSALVSLFLQAPTPVKNTTLLNALTIAVRSGSLQTVKLIVEAADLAHERSLPAIEEAVTKGQLELLLAILPYAQHQSTSFLDDLILKTFESNSMTIETKGKIFEALFYAGASGDKSAATFVLAVEQQPSLIDIFAKHHVDINWGNAKAVRRALRNGESDLVRRVLASGGLRADCAALTLDAIPRNTPPRERLEILRMLLEYSPNGTAVDMQLVFAVQHRLDAAIILLRDYGASLDTNDGAALVEAIKMEQVTTVRHLLSRAVDPSVLNKAFPHLRRVGKLARRLMTGLLLDAKASGTEVDAALRDAVCDQDQDSELIDLLIKGSADPAYCESQSMRHAISTEDVELLQKLLRSPAEISSNAVSSLVIHGMREASGVRLQLLQELIEADASEDSLSRALLYELSQSRCDDNIVHILFSRGNADPNFEDGKPLCAAALQSNDDSLALLTTSARTTRTSRRNAIVSLFQSRLMEGVKAARASMLVDVGKCETVVLAGLKAQLDVCRVTYNHGRQWPLDCFRVLLKTKPDLELDGGDDIKTIIEAAALPLLTLVLKVNLSQPALRSALLHSLTIVNQQDRFESCQAILQARPSRDTLSTALLPASEKCQRDICQLLLTAGAQIEHNDHAAIRSATCQADEDLLRIILEANPPRPSLIAAFNEAKSLPVADDRLNMLRMILNAGPENFQGDFLDQYLVAIVQSEDCDTRLIQLLLDKGAVVEAFDGQSVVFAAVHCKLELLKQLWSCVTLLDTATHCFEQCLEAELVRRFKLDILQFLLQHGARGQSLDHALRKAVEALADNSLPLDMVNLLLSFGADPNHQEGASVCGACEIGRVDAVEALVVSKSDVDTRSNALHHVLMSDPGLTLEHDFCQMIDLLIAPRPWDAGFPGSNEAPAYSKMQAKFDPAIRVLLERRPGGAQELEKVLKSGHKFSARHDSDILAWSMRLTTPKIDAHCIELLIEHGANARFVDSHSGESLIMIAIRSGKSRVLGSLISPHADVSLKDKHGRSPLLLAVQKGDADALAVLLAADPATNDGSLHQAVRTLNPHFVKMLLHKGHSATLPSSWHGRRTPLVELVCNVQANATNLDAIVKIIHLLQKKGADVTKRFEEKPLICLALDNGADMAEALLRAYLDKLINEDFNHYWSGRFCYSPTMYVHEKLCSGPVEQLAEKRNVLRAYGADKDVFYACKGRQPEGARGVPGDLMAAELLAQQKEQQLAEEEAEHQTRLRRVQEAAREAERAKAVELTQQLESARAIERQEQENLKLRHDLNRALRREAWADEQSRELERQRILQHERKEELQHQAARASAALSQQKQLQYAEQEHQAARASAALSQQKQLQYAEQAHQKQIQNQSYLAIEQQVNLQKALERTRDSHHASQHERRMQEITLAKANPVGAPYMLEGGNNQRRITDVDSDDDDNMTSVVSMRGSYGSGIRVYNNVSW